MKGNINITDNDGRTLLKVRSSRVLVARYTDMDLNTKNIVTEFYTNFTGEDSKSIMGFLNFENDEMEFCS